MPPTQTLRILQTTDLHAHLRPHDYFTDRPTPGQGLAALATLIEDARKDGLPTLLLDTGDVLQGTPLGDIAAQSEGRDPIFAAMEVLRYDAAVPGNHDFDFGLDHFLDAARAVSFPMLAANFDDMGGTPFLARWAVLERDILKGNPPLRIGLIGVLPPQTAMWNAHFFAGRARVGDMVTAVRNAIEHMPDVDLTIVLAHSGLGTVDVQPNAENAARAIAGLPGVDAVLAAHTHVQLPETPQAYPKGTVPILQAGASGRCLGVLDLELLRDPSGWQITGSRAELRRANEKTPASQVVIRATDDLHERTLAAIREPIGQTECALHSYFAALTHDPAAALVAEATIAVARDLPGRPDLPVVAAVAPFRAARDTYVDIAPGPLLLRHMSKLYPYTNAFAVVSVTVADVRDWLDRGTLVLRQVAPGHADQALVDTTHPLYTADSLWGLQYEVDVSRPPRFDQTGLQVHEKSRIGEIQMEGQVLRDTDRLLVATNSYRVAGAGGYPWLAEAERLPVPPGTVRDILAKYVRSDSPLRPSLKPPVKLVGAEGVQVTLETGKGALAFLDDIAHLAPAILGAPDNGRIELRLTL